MNIEPRPLKPFAVLALGLLALLSVVAFGRAVRGGEPLLGGPTVLTAPQGGTGLSSFVRGDLIYATSTNRLQRLAIGSNGQTLVLSSGIPAWSSNLQWTAATGSTLELTGTGTAYTATGTHIFGGAMTIANGNAPGADNVQIGFEQSAARTAGGGLDTYKSYSPLNIYATTTGFQDTFTITAGGNGVDGACFAAKNLGTTLGRQCQTSSPLNYWIMSYGGLALQSGNTTPYNPSIVDFMIRDNKVGIGGGIFSTPNTLLEVTGTTSGTQAIFGRGATSTLSGIQLGVVGTGVTSTVQIGDSAKAFCIKAGDTDKSGYTYLTVNDGILYSSTTPCN